jgi:hypothetical protein
MMSAKRAGTSAAGLVAVALLAAACGGGSGPGVASVGSSTTSTLTSPAVNSGDTATQTKAGLKFVSCMRSHGVPSMPDPLPAGGFSRSSLSAAEGIPASEDNDVGGGRDETLASSQFKAALKSCESAAVAYGFINTPATIAKYVERDTEEDACIRTHGYPNMPDPNAKGQQMLPPGIDPSSPKFEEVEKVCTKPLP